MATINVDGKTYEVKDGQNLLQACLSAGLNVPYFCWHPAMGSVGACRLCAVNQYQDEKDTRGRVVMSCMTPAANNTRISIDHPDTKAFRKSVLEWLMANHPHDCAVCDEGGQCHLQDMTVMAGQVYREYRFNKRTYKNQDLGPFINHEMNRCIDCYRCVRFYKDYAGGRDLDVFGAHDRLYFGRHEDGPLESEFSGNLVEVCPTGVFTDKTLKKHYTRKWDMSNAPSVCNHCSVGCNTIPGERYGALLNVWNRYNGEVNGYFLCDRGRFGYEFVNHSARLRRVSLRLARAAGMAPSDKAAAVGHVAGFLTKGGRVAGIGSPRASVESNFALRELVGAENFYLGVSQKDFELANLSLSLLKGPARSASLHDVEQCDAIFILGEDVTNTAPRLALSLRQSSRRQPLEAVKKMGIPSWHDLAAREVAQKEKGPCFILTPAATRLDDIATETRRLAPEDIARLGFAVAHELNNAAPAVKGLSAEENEFARRIAQALKTAQRPVVVSGTGLGSAPVLEAAAQVAWALSAARPADLYLVTPEANSLGLAMMGGKPLAEALKTTPEVAIILENDLYRRADGAAVNAFLDAAAQVVVLDHLATATAAKADVLLPAATFAEGDGTFISSEGRAQRFFQVFAPKDGVLESWRWLADIMAVSRQLNGARWKNLDDVLAAVAQAAPLFTPAAEAAPHADFRIAGQKMSRQSHRATGRTAILADVNVSEPKPPEDPDAPFSFTMEGYMGPQAPGALVNRFWAPGWNSVQSLNKFQSEVGGPLAGGDPGKRLLEPSQIQAAYKTAGEAFQKRAGEWLAVPLYHIFGSEELSAHAPGVAERAPKPYVALGAEEAQKLGLSDGAPVRVAMGATVLKLPMRVQDLPAGVAGLPAGLPGIPEWALPGWVKVEKA